LDRTVGCGQRDRDDGPAYLVHQRHDNNHPQRPDTDPIHDRAIDPDDIQLCRAGNG